MHDWGYILAFLSWNYSICNSYSLITGFYGAAFFFFLIFVLNSKFFCILPVFSMLTPGSLLHSSTGISIFLTWIFNSVVSLDLRASSGMLHLFLSFFFLSPCWLFYGGFWIYRGHLTGSSLQWDHKHCRKICSLLQHCFSSPWLPSQGIPFWQ